MNTKNKVEKRNGSDERQLLSDSFNFRTCFLLVLCILSTDEELLSSLENLVVDQTSSSSERRGSTPGSQVSGLSADKRSFKSSSKSEFKGDPSSRASKEEHPSRASRLLDKRSVATTAQTKSTISKVTIPSPTPSPKKGTLVPFLSLEVVAKSWSTNHS